MKINVLFSPLTTDELFFTSKTTVVIDVLRASSTIITALNNGAREVIPVNSVEFAMKVSGNAFGGQTLLGGERNTKKIEGFHLGNSPLEYTRETVSGKSLILFTTNGSKAVVKAKFSENLYICAFANIHAVARQIVALDKDVVVLCAGVQGAFCIEDSVCAGKVVAEVQKLNESAELSDAAKASVILAKSFGKNINRMLLECEHGRTLSENGFDADISYCSKINTTEILPYFANGIIKAIHPQEAQLQEEK
ncbi:MAG: 2-phosphosulfolactate phosphatase [Bacteroidota bacterium]